MSGSNFDLSGECTRRPDYGPAVIAGKKTIDAALQWLPSQALADMAHVILVGQSVGGLITVAAGADPAIKVAGYINFAGGTGGNPERAPGRSCDPQQLTRLYAGFGKSTKVPCLWIYAQNDQYWGPDVPPAWHAAFAAGGSPTQFVHAPEVSNGDGHGLSRHQRELWAPYVDPFVRSLGIALHTPEAVPASKP